MKTIQVPRRFVREEWGGTETVILETSKRLNRQGHPTKIFCANTLATTDSEEMDGISIQRFPYFYPYFGLHPNARAQLDKKGGNLFSWQLLRALQNEKNIDILHLHTGKRVGGIVRYVAKERGIPYVMSLHGGIFDVPTAEAQSWIEPTKGALEWGKLLGMWVGARRVMDDCAAILCVGEQERIQTQKRYPHKNVLHLPNGVDTERFAKGDGAGFRAKHGIHQKARVILTMGRIDPQKNQRFAVSLLPELLRTVPEAHLLCIGHVTNPDYLAQIEQDTAKLGLQDHVTILKGLDSASSELVDAYHSADVFLLPSIHEPFGIVILEAWSAGLPVVASAVGGIPSFVVQGEDGLLFPSMDAHKCMTSLTIALQNHEMAQTLAENGKAKAYREYHWDAITHRLVQIYEEAIRAYSVRT